MQGRGAGLALAPMNEHDQHIVEIATHQFERRLAEESGKLRVDMATEFGRIRADMAVESGKLRAEMATGFGALRSEMIDRNAEMLKWMLCFFAAQLASMAALLTLFR